LEDSYYRKIGKEKEHQIGQKIELLIEKIKSKMFHFYQNIKYIILNHIIKIVNQIKKISKNIK